MKKIILLSLVTALVFFTSCTVEENNVGPQGPQGIDGVSVEAEVFELKNINFGFNSADGYNIYQTLNPQILPSDVVLIYRMSGLINSTTPIWQQIPRTLFLPEGELDYDFDFSKQDFTIYAGGTYNLALTPSYINNQTFRIVIIPGFFAGKSAQSVNHDDYNEVIKAYGINDKVVKVLN